MVAGVPKVRIVFGADVGVPPEQQVAGVMGRSAGGAAAWDDAVRTYSSQFSTFSPGIRLNSKTFAVTAVAANAQACAAISRSFDPIGRPSASSLARMPPYALSAGTSNGSTGTSASNASTRR